jgi:RimJ/RimL family protein N-acetyltransferase
MDDGRSVVVRPIRPGDRDRLERFHERLGDTSVYRRFFYLHRHLSAEELDRFTRVDGCDRLALVALAGAAVVGVGRYDRLPPGDRAEVAFVVADDWQGHGIASALLCLLAAAARTHGCRTLEAQTLAENQAMRSVFEKFGFEGGAADEDGIVQLTCVLPAAEDGGPSALATEPASVHDVRMGRRGERDDGA